MCIHEGVRLNRVTIVEDENTAGSCAYENLFPGNRLEMDHSGRIKLKMEKRARIALAGVIAQKLYRPRSVRRYHASEDYKNVSEYALRANGSANEAEAWLLWLEIGTQETLQTCWSAVEGLAEELLRVGTLDREQMRMLWLNHLAPQAGVPLLQIP